MSELKSLTPEQKRDYVKNRSGNCPYCGSMDLDGGSFEMSGTSVSQHISCRGCGREWDDVYKLVSIDEDGQELETPDHPEVIVVEPEYGTDGRVGWWALPDQRFDCAVPPSSTCPATAADLSDVSPAESPKEKQDRNCKAELMTSKEWDDVAWMMGTGRYRQ